MLDHKIALIVCHY